MAWFRKKYRSTYRPPVPPPPEAVRAAEGKARKAEKDLAEVRARDPEIRERGEYLAEIHRINRIGPKFWAAVSLRKEPT